MGPERNWNLAMTRWRWLSTELMVVAEKKLNKAITKAHMIASREEIVILG